MDTAPSRIDHDTRTYIAGLRERRLDLARCGDCQHWIHPPRACCPACWSDNVGHATPSGKARLYTYLTQPLAPGEPPTVIAWAELVEQPRLIIVAPLVDVAPDKVEIGGDLTLCWIEQGGAAAPAFRMGAAT
jgi:uncharacterized protein